MLKVETFYPPIGKETAMTRIYKFSVLHKIKLYGILRDSEQLLKYNDWTSGISKEEKEELILHLLNHGLSRKEAEDYCSRNIKIANFFSDNPTAGYSFVKGKMISYGKKANTSI